MRRRRAPSRRPTFLLLRTSSSTRLPAISCGSCMRRDSSTRRDAHEGFKNYVEGASPSLPSAALAPLSAPPHLAPFACSSSQPRSRWSYSSGALVTSTWLDNMARTARCVGLAESGTQHIRAWHRAAVKLLAVWNAEPCPLVPARPRTSSARCTFASRTRWPMRGPSSACGGAGLGDGAAHAAGKK